MPRSLRHCPGGTVFHVLNRANLRLPLFEHPGDFRAFEAVLEQAQERTGTRVLAYCVMPNHWHLVLWPETDGEVSAMVGWLTLTHTQRWHAAHETVGTGHLYQGRFKSFPVQDDAHLLTVCRYVERNPLRAGLVARAQDWQWSSLWRRGSGDAGSRSLLAEWPVARPADWLTWVNEPPSEAETGAIRRSAQRGQPFGDATWTAAAVARLGLAATFRRPGRPRKPG
jgi:putative transposase